MPMDLEIPATSPWLGFDGDNFVKALSVHAVELEEAYAEFAKVTATPQVLEKGPEELRAIDDNALAICYELHSVFLYLTASRGAIDDLRERLSGGSLLPNAVWETKEPLEPRALAKILLALFVYPRFFKLLRHIVVDYTDKWPKPWRVWSKKLEKRTGRCSVASFLRFFIEQLCKVIDRSWTEQGKQPMELSALHFAADIIGHCISCEVFGCSEQIAPIKIRQLGLQFMNLEGDIVDTCNACGREADRLDLKRCGRCKVAHYCNSEHQKIAWKAGHKDVCEQA